MEDYYSEIAYYAKLSRICLFTGTGFSKAVSDNEAPSWKGLLEEACDLSVHSDELKHALFSDELQSPLSLEESAQVIALQLQSEGLLLHAEIASIIDEIDISDNIPNISQFARNNNFTAITTNYDNLLETIIGKDRCSSISPGSPVPKRETPSKVYHVHGSTLIPANMIITSDDYFNFMNEESYFSRKLSTLLHENTVIILGYSLNDTNLKRIISSYRSLAKKEATSSNIFFVAKRKVPQETRSLYRHCFGIRVIDETEVEDFFFKLNNKIGSLSASDIEEITDVSEQAILDPTSIDRDYLKFRDSFFELASSLSSLGFGINDQRIHKIFDHMISTKRELCLERDQWDQYPHLASWLVYVCQAFDIENTLLRETILSAVLWSMCHSSGNRNRLGYSWEAYDVWCHHWNSITLSNKHLIKDYILANTEFEAAVAIVNS